MTDELDHQIADAIKQRFKDRIAAKAGIPFDETGVTVPADDVWLDYANAARRVVHDEGYVHYFDEPPFTDAVP